MKTKVKPNRYKPEASNRETSTANIGISIDFCLKWTLTIAGISILSLASIFAYDLVTQSALFAVKQISVAGNQRVSSDEIISFADLDEDHNLFKLNIHTLEKKISSHPWIASANVKRRLPSGLEITVTEHTALAIVKIENIADIIINTQGQPFKEYNPQTDDVEELPVITGLDLTRTGTQYLFDGTLFNAVMDFLKVANTDQGIKIGADRQLGITVESRDIYNRVPSGHQPFIRIKLGFGDYERKFKKAGIIGDYMSRHFPEKSIVSMDLFNLKKIFVKTRRNDTKLDTLEKGV